ncbi:MAG: aminopeptidase [Trueperaceae bacterium]|nr:aminopeptidase [Trueperaceae bacterium]
MPKSQEVQIAAFADLVVKVGLNLQAGQRLLIRSAVEGAEFARLVTQRAYAAGCAEVDVIWNDDTIALERLKHAAEERLNEYPPYLAQGHIDAANRADAVLSIRCSDPELYKGQDSSRLKVVERATRTALRPFFEKITTSALNWCLVSVPGQAWAAKLFPDEAKEQQKAKLWTAILKTVRADLDDPNKAWQEHLEGLERRREYLDQKQYQSLRYRAKGTDLEIGLVENHLWMGGIQPTPSGIIYVANMPTEEVFTMPHKNRVNGLVSSSLPLSHNGSLIEDFVLEFKDGQVVSAKARSGEDTLHRILDTDEGARRLGEVALVPHSSPISQLGILFYDTLFDENAASHLALGRAYAFTVKDGTTWTPQQAAEHGVNDSLTHVDFMIGSADMDIDGVSKNGSLEPVMRQGEWAF